MFLFHHGGQCEVSAVEDAQIDITTKFKEIRVADTNLYSGNKGVEPSFNDKLVQGGCRLSYLVGLYSVTKDRRFQAIQARVKKYGTPPTDLNELHAIAEWTMEFLPYCLLYTSYGTRQMVRAKAAVLATLQASKNERRFLGLFER